MTQPDPEKLNAALAWFHKAELDLRAAAHDLSAEPPLTGSSVFHSQQAVEKAIKGLLFWNDSPFRRTHSIRELSLDLAKVTQAFDSILEQAADLTPYATVFRYPGEEAEPSLKEAEDAVALARQAVRALRSALPSE